MSIALNPIVKGYHEAQPSDAILAAVPRGNLVRSRKNADSRALARLTTGGLQLIHTVSVLAVSGALLVFAGWSLLSYSASLAAQFESLSAMQLLHALAGF